MKLLAVLLIAPFAVGVIWLVDLAAGRRPWDLLVAAAVVVAVVGLDYARAERRRPVRMHRSIP